MSKKSTSLTFNVVVGAVIAILVLVVLSMMFIKKTNDAYSNLCETKYGGVCKEIKNCLGVPYYGTECEKDHKICCVEIKKEDSSSEQDTSNKK